MHFACITFPCVFGNGLPAQHEVHRMVQVMCRERCCIGGVLRVLQHPPCTVEVRVFDRGAQEPWACLLACLLACLFFCGPSPRAPNSVRDHQLKRKIPKGINIGGTGYQRRKGDVNRRNIWRLTANFVDGKGRWSYPEAVVHCMGHALALIFPCLRKVDMGHSGLTPTASAIEGSAPPCPNDHRLAEMPAGHHESWFRSLLLVSRRTKHIDTPRASVSASFCLFLDSPSLSLSVSCKLRTRREWHGAARLCGHEARVLADDYARGQQQIRFTASPIFWAQRRDTAAAVHETRWTPSDKRKNENRVEPRTYLSVCQFLYGGLSVVM